MQSEKILQLGIVATALCFSARADRLTALALTAMVMARTLRQVALP